MTVIDTSIASFIVRCEYSVKGGGLCQTKFRPTAQHAGTAHDARQDAGRHGWGVIHNYNETLMLDLCPKHVRDYGDGS